ncbi:MAG: glycoside hydrolase family 99-like domain-containing protein [Verrucomicrobiota bacterium]
MSGNTPSAMNTLPGLVALLMLPLAVLCAGQPERPIVGAIRWDAWYGTNGPVKETEVTLGPPKYHFRLPWFARLVGADKVSINGDSQAIVETEIAYAAEAGLNYWAFVDYWDDANLSIALRRYRAAKDKRGVRYCLIEEGGRLDTMGVRGWARLVDHFKDPNYQTGCEGRPLLFVFGKPQRLGKNAWQELGAAATAAGLKPPYIVLMGWQPQQDAKDMQALGFDAISAYACGGSYTMTPPSYAQQCAGIRRDRWEKCRALGLQCVTFASAGWDTRPRNERPPSWITGVAASPDNTPPAQQKPLMDAVTATPDQLANHLREAVDWTQHNRDLNPSNAIIIYGWNENDEGGWLIPTLGADGRPNEERIKAVSNVLRVSSSLTPSTSILPPTP